MSQEEEEIQAIIKKSLPAHVGDVLKARLEQADKDEKALKDAKQVIDELQKTNTELRKDLILANKAIKDEESLYQREIALAEGIRNLKIETLEYQLANEKDKTDFTKQVAMGLVRNTTFRKTVFDSENQNPYPVPDGNGGSYMAYPSTVHKSLNENSSEE